MRSPDRDQLVSDLLLAHPAAARLAVLLTGNEELSRQIVREVMVLAVGQWPSWLDGEPAPAGWFLHHTLLASRAVVFSDDPLPDPEALLGGAMLRGSPADPEFAAFVRAMRKLPFQQLEAVVMYDVLGHDLRASSVAMDMSTTATANHLESGRATLRVIAGERFESMMEKLRAFAQSFVPNNSVVLPEILAEVRKRSWAPALRWAGTIASLIAIAVIMYYFYGVLKPFLRW